MGKVVPGEIVGRLDGCGAACGLKESRPKVPAENGDDRGDAPALLGVGTSKPAPRLGELGAASSCLKVCIRPANAASGTTGLLLESLLPWLKKSL